MVDIATLGISVDSSGAAKGAADIDKVSTSAKGATTNVNQLTDATQKYNVTINSNTARVAQQAQQFASLGKAAHDAGEGHSHLAHQVHAVHSGLQLTGTALAAHATGLGNISASTVKAAEQLGNFNFKATQLRTGLRVLRPIVSEMGASLGNLGQLAGAGRAGFAILAAVITATFLTALEKAADAARVLKQNLTDLSGGNIAQGAKEFKLLSDAASKAGIEVSVMADSFQAVKRVAREVAETKGIRQSDGSVFGFKPEDVTAALKTMVDMLQISGLGAEKTKAALDGFFVEMSKGGNLTKEIFDKLELASPRAAAAISRAFNYVNVEQFRTHLDQVPESASKVIAALKRIGPAISEEASTIPKTIEQQIDALKADFEHLMVEFGEKGGIKFASDFIAGARKVIHGEWPDMFKKVLDTKITAADIVNMFDLTGPIPTDKLIPLGKFIDKDAPVEFPIDKILKVLDELDAELEKRGIKLWDPILPKITAKWDEFWATADLGSAVLNAVTKALNFPGRSIAEMLKGAFSDVGKEGGGGGLMDWFMNGPKGDAPLFGGSKEKTDAAAKELPQNLDKTAEAMGKLSTEAATDATRLVDAFNQLAAPANAILEITTASAAEKAALEGLPGSINQVTQATTQLGPAATTAAAAVAAAVAQIRAAAAGAAAAGSGGGSYGDQTGITAGSAGGIDLGSNARGGIYKMPGSGAGDSISIGGKVSPGETIAIIPSEKMTGSLMSLLSDTIAQSPISVGTGGSSYISSPASYSAEDERRAKLAFTLTQEQKQSALSRIAQASAKAGAGTDDTSAMQVLMNSKGLGSSGGGGFSFKPTSKPLWNDKEFQAQFQPYSGDASVNKSVKMIGSGSTGQMSSPNAKMIQGTAPFEGKGIITPDTPFAGKGIKTGPEAFDWQGPLGPDMFPWQGPLSSEMFPWQGPLGPDMFDWQGPTYEPSLYNPSQPYVDYGPSMVDAFQPSYDPPASFDDRFGPYDTTPTGPSMEPSFDEMWGGNDYFGDSGGGVDGSVYGGAYARGGSFRVPQKGSPGRDSVRTVMDLTPGEQVSIGSGSEQIGGSQSKGGSGGHYIENINIVTPGDNPLASLSRNAIRRELSGWMS